MLEGLRTPTEVIVIVVALLAYDCPIQAIVHAFGLDERTVASWRDRAGKQCQKVHQAVIEQGKLDLVHVQADEIWWPTLSGSPSLCVILRRQSKGKNREAWGEARSYPLVF